MKKWLIALVALMSQCAFALQTTYKAKEGDFVFQSLPKGDLVEAIEGVSSSPYSHVGMVIRKDGAWFVREAIGEVQDTPLDEWQARGRMHHAFDAFRLKADFQKFVPDFIKASEAFLGRPYDFKYDMDDGTIYCSELLYKAMFKASGLHLGKLQQLGQLRWKPYRKTIEKYEEGKAPLHRLMLTPRALSEAMELEKVFDGYPQQ